MMKSRVLLSIVLLVLVAGCGRAAEPVEVTGGLPAPTEEISGEASGEPIAGVGLSQVRGTIYRGPIAGLSDERVNGNAEHVMDIDFVVEGDRTTGLVTVTKMTIANEDGTWQGTGAGTTSWTKTDPEHFHSLDYTLVGTGDYEGLQFRYHVEGVDYPWDLTGTIEPVDS